MFSMEFSKKYVSGDVVQKQEALLFEGLLPLSCSQGGNNLNGNFNETFIFSIYDIKSTFCLYTNRHKNK